MADPVAEPTDVPERPAEDGSAAGSRQGRQKRISKVKAWLTTSGLALAIVIAFATGLVDKILNLIFDRPTTIVVVQAAPASAPVRTLAPALSSSPVLSSAPAGAELSIVPEISDAGARAFARNPGYTLDVLNKASIGDQKAMAEVIRLDAEAGSAAVDSLTVKLVVTAKSDPVTIYDILTVIKSSGPVLSGACAFDMGPQGEERNIPIHYSFGNGKLAPIGYGSSGGVIDPEPYFKGSSISLKPQETVTLLLEFRIGRAAVVFDLQFVMANGTGRHSRLFDNDGQHLRITGKASGKGAYSRVLGLSRNEAAERLVWTERDARSFDGNNCEAEGGG